MDRRIKSEPQQPEAGIELTGRRDSIIINIIVDLMDLYLRDKLYFFGFERQRSVYRLDFSWIKIISPFKIVAQITLRQQVGSGLNALKTSLSPFGVQFCFQLILHIFGKVNIALGSEILGGIFEIIAQPRSQDIVKLQAGPVGCVGVAQTVPQLRLAPHPVKPLADVSPVIEPGIIALDANLVIEEFEVDTLPGGVRIKLCYRVNPFFQSAGNCFVCETVFGASRYCWYT